LCHFVQLIRGLPFAIGAENRRPVFDLLDPVGPPARRKLAEDIFCYDPEEKQRLIADIAGDVSMLMSIWNRVCDPQSREFDRAFFDRNGEALLRGICGRIEAGDEPEVLTILQFVEASVAHPKAVRSLRKCTHCHLFGVIPFLFPRLNDANGDVSAAASAVLAMLDAVLEKITDE
jgi:hypothetical protein